MNAHSPNIKVEPITIDPHYTTSFYAELWGVSRDTVERWFQDEPGVLKFPKSKKRGEATRTEIRIPFSLAMRVYRDRCK